HVAADLRAGILQRRVRRLGAERHPRALARRRTGCVGDLAAADEDRRARIDHLTTTHFTRAAISSAPRPASTSTLLVCSPRLATLGPLFSAEPEKRNGGAGERKVPALSSIGHSEPRWATCGSFSAS